MPHMMPVVLWVDIAIENSTETDIPNSESQNGTEFFNLGSIWRTAGFNLQGQFFVNGFYNRLPSITRSILVSGQIDQQFHKQRNSHCNSIVHRSQSNRLFPLFKIATPIDKFRHIRGYTAYTHYAVDNGVRYRFFIFVDLGNQVIFTQLKQLKGYR